MTNQPDVKVRGLSKGFERTPLKKFVGTFDGYAAKAVEGRRPGTVIDLMFKDLDMATIESSSPYEFPIAVIGVRYSDVERSSWGIFAASFSALVPDGLELADAKGSVWEMKLTPGHEFKGLKDEESGQDVVIEAWEVQSIEGLEGVAVSRSSPTRRALELLDGHTQQEWQTGVFADPTVKSDAVLTQTILQNTFLPAKKQEGVITQDESEVWHVDFSKVE